MKSIFTGALIGDEHTLRDWGAIITNSDCIGMPEPNTVILEIPGRSGRLDEKTIAAVNRNEHSNAAPANTFAAAKTSTAQTGRYGEDGRELCHAWITGYFPLDKPKYAVTVLVEDGGYGNDAAAPIFRTIAETLTAREQR